MGTLQSPSPNPYPNRSLVPNANNASSPSPNPYPNRNPVPNANNTVNPSPNANTAPGPKSPSFEDVSKLFSLPLSDAADSLGICPSVLKKVCYDNGLVRWPYRKFLAGKSIEEIKKDAAMEKEKQLAEVKVSGQNISLASSAVSASLAPQPQSTNTVSSQQTPTSRLLAQQPTRDNQIEPLHNMNSSTANKAITLTSDEFKYGFPSDGLSSISYKWWGNKTSSKNGVDDEKSSTGDAEERKQQPKDSMDVSQGERNKRDGDSQWASSLSALRKRVAEDGQHALKLGVYRDYNLKTLDRTKKTVLLQIFRSSLPSECGDMLSES